MQSSRQKPCALDDMKKNLEQGRCSKTDGTNESNDSPRPSNRDSGYFTDNSPAMFQNSRFTFDTTENYSSENIPEDVDEEVAMVMTNSPEGFASPRAVARPVPPILRNISNVDENPSSPSSLLFHNMSSRRMRSHPYRYFQPISENTTGTQTPSSHSQLISEVTTHNNTFLRFHPNRIPVLRGHAPRQRFLSEGEEASNLPDVVQSSRDRSISLPDVHHQERVREVGRELRRLSDEFNHIHSTTARTQPRRQSVSLGPNGVIPEHAVPVSFNLQDLMHQIRHVFSSPAQLDHQGEQRR